MSQSRCVVVCALLLVVAAAATAPDSATSEEAAAAAGATDGAAKGLSPQMACEACHAFVDSFYLQLNSEFQARKKHKAHNKVLELSSDELMWEACDGMLKSDVYGPKIIKMCREFMAANRDAIRKTFADKFEVSDNVEHFWVLKRRLCDATVPGCVRTPTRGRPDSCSACTHLMADAQRTVSWGFGRANYGSKHQIFRALDDLCNSIPVRYGLTGRDVLFETCADLIDEYSATIVSSIQAAIPPPHKDPTTFICVEKAKLCRVDGVESLGASPNPRTEL